MILKGSQRGGAGALARHLLRMDENEHVKLRDVRGFVAEDVHGALAEAEAIAKGTKCKQHLFSLSLNPPKDGAASPDDLVAAADEAEKRLGLAGCHRIIVEHEKNGRRHAHAVWSRIDPNTLKSVNMAFFKTRLAELSKDLYLQHGWELPEGHEKGQANPLNFELPEGQTAKRAGLDPKELKGLFQEAWKHSTDLQSFAKALSDKGFTLAKGDRRAFVAIDLNGKIYSVSRLTGVRPKDLQARLGSPDQLEKAGKLQKVEAVKAGLDARLTPAMRDTMKQTRRKHRRELTPLKWKRRKIVRAQRTARKTIGSANRRSEATRNKQRVIRVKDWKRGALQHLTGDLPNIRARNAGEANEDYQKFRRRMELLFEEQLEELRMLQRHIDRTRARQQAEQLAMMSRMALAERLRRNGEKNAAENYPHQLALEF